MVENKPYPGDFIHAINLDNWYPCHNIAISGRLWSPDFAASDPGLAASHRCIKDMSIEDLKSGKLGGVLSPRTFLLSYAPIIRSGGHIGTGSIDTQWWTQLDMDTKLRLADIEVAFEEVRRYIAPKAVSRLSCIWVAENTDAGKEHVRSMLRENILILKVTIPNAIGVSKVDTSWFDEYWRNPKQEYIENYWRGVPLNPNEPKWEYLVDGVVEVNDPEGLEKIRKEGGHLTLR